MIENVWQITWTEATSVYRLLSVAEKKVSDYCLALPCRGKMSSYVGLISDIEHNICIFILARWLIIIMKRWVARGEKFHAERADKSRSWKHDIKLKTTVRVSVNLTSRVATTDRNSTVLSGSTHYFSRLWPFKFWGNSTLKIHLHLVLQGRPFRMIVQCMHSLEGGFLKGNRVKICTESW